MSTDEPILPVVQGDWVARSGGGQFEIARVRQAYWDDGRVYCDLVPHSLDGEKLGRVTPAEGGPKAFEPWCLFTDNGWQRIERPEFPLKREMMYIPVEGDPDKVRLEVTVFHDRRYGAAKPKAIRTTRRKQSQDYPRRPTQIVYVDKPMTANQLEVDMASKRAAAQELRNQARFLGGEAAMALRHRAETLEHEVEKLAGTKL